MSALSKTSRILLGIVSVALVSTLFLPLWLIQLDAPQYPEGLELKIYTDGLGGQVDIINGLNHYIGMGTLHSENFIEFTILPYIIGGFALLALINAFWANKRVLYFLFFSFLLFGVLSMVDFWRWEYDYGHNLDPNAAIIVPGMAYQPPLIGFKQLLNFGAYSIPDIGGWLFIISGLLMLVALLIETDKIKKILNSKNIVLPSILFFAIMSLGCISCDHSKPIPISLNKDACDDCKMTISDGNFAAEIITEKGRCYKFDDLQCLVSYYKTNPKLQAQFFYVHAFNGDNVLMDINSSFLVQSKDFKSPMGGNIAAVQSKEAADELLKKYPQAVLLSWNTLLNP